MIILVDDEPENAKELAEGTELAIDVTLGNAEPVTLGTLVW